MEDIIYYYAIFKDGSNVLLKNLDEIVSLPNYEHILKETIHPGYHIRENEFIFIDKSGNRKNLRIGDWEVVYIQSENKAISLSPGQTYKTIYKLFNHNTQTVFEFDRYVRGVNFFKEELFPQLLEYSGNPILQSQNYGNTLTAILSELSDIKNVIKSIQSDLNNKFSSQTSHTDTSQTNNNVR